MRFVIFNSFMMIALFWVGCTNVSEPVVPPPSHTEPADPYEIYEGNGTVILAGWDIENEDGRFGFSFWPYGQTPVEFGFKEGDYVHFKAEILSADTIRVDPYYWCYLLSIKLAENN